MAFLIAGTTMLLTFGVSAPAFADNGPHVTTAFGSLDGSGNVVQSPGQDNVRTDRCAGCHRAHTASGSMLLMVSDESQLCYSCHGSAGVGATTDVVDGVQYSQANRTSPIAGALRGGGFSKAELGNASVTIVNGSRGLSADKSKTVIAVGAQQNTTSAHDVNSGQALVAWGGGAPGSGTGTTLNAATALECTSCHDPHGNGNYRILRPVPVGAPTGTAAVTIADSSTKVYTTTNYWLVDDPNSATVNGYTGTPNTSAFLGNISSWCATCHTRILSPSGGYAAALVSINTGATSYTGSFVGGNATVTFTGTVPSGIAVGDNIAFTTITPTNAPPANLQPGFGTNMLYRVFSINATTLTFGNPTSATALKPTTGYNGNVTFVSGTQTTPDGNFTFRHRSDNGTVSLPTGVTTRGVPTNPDGSPNMNILGQNNPNCVTCHVAHGSNADMSGDANSQFSKTVKDPAGNVPAGGDSYLLRVSNRGMCKMCHNL
jgi:predicted CXXCH cytochrome family protein